MTTATTNTNVPIGLALKEAAIAGAIAAVINFIFFYVARLIIGGPLSVVDSPVGESIGIVPILLFSIIPALVAGVLYWALDKFLANPNPAFLGISALVFIGFIFGPISSAANPAIGWILEIMHGVVAVPVIMAMLSLKAKI